MAEWLGRTIGNYRVEDLLGAGGMGQVYRARHIHLDREIALKVLHTDFAQNANFVTRFRQEARAAAALRHPNIVEVYDFGEQDNICYLAMELVTGGALRGLLRRRNEPGNKEWNLPRGLSLVREAARALNFAHQHGVVHRDVKPDNILLVPQTGVPLAYSARLSDFGLARLAENSGLTASGMTMGTPAYISPEQGRGEEVDGRSDLYSLGIVLYEVATGLLPFAVKTLSDAVYKHIHVAPPPPRSVAPTMSPELEAVILRCIAKAPQDRFATGADLDAALANVPEAQAEGYVGNTAATSPSGRLGLKTEAAPNGAVINTNIPMPVSVMGSSLLPRVQTLDGQGKMLSIQEIGGDGLTVGRLPTNNIMLDAGEVSRHHLRLDWDGSAVIVTDLGSSNGTFLSGSRLTPQTPARWNAQDSLQIGSFFLRLIPPVTANVAAVAANVSNSEVGKAASGGLIGVALEEEHLSLTPGKQESLRITVANLGNKVEHLEVEVEGVPESWVKKPPRPTQLNPGTQATIPIGIEPPRTPQSKVGEYPVIVRVRSRETPERFGQATGSWAVLPFNGAVMTMTPLKNGGITEAKYTLNLSNEGNANARWNLKATDDEQALVYDFDPPQLNLAPGEISNVHLTVQAERRWLGTPLTRPFTIQTSAGSDGGANGNGTPVALTQSGQFVHRAVLPPWAPPVALVVLAAIPVAWKTLAPKPGDANPVVIVSPSSLPSPLGTPVASASVSTTSTDSVTESPAPGASAAPKTDGGTSTEPTPTPDPTPTPTPEPTPTPRPDRSADTADVQLVALGRIKNIRDRIATAQAILAMVKDVPATSTASGYNRYRLRIRPLSATQSTQMSDADKTTLASKALVRFPERKLSTAILLDSKRFPRPYFSPRPVATPSVVMTPPPPDMSAQQVASQRISDLSLRVSQVWAGIIAMGIGRIPQSTEFALDDPPTIRAGAENMMDFGVPKFSSLALKDLYSRMLVNQYVPMSEREKQEHAFEALVSRYEHPEQYPLVPLYSHIVVYGANPASIGSAEYKDDMQQIENWLKQVEQDMNDAESCFH